MLGLYPHLPSSALTNPYWITHRCFQLWLLQANAISPTILFYVLFFCFPSLCWILALFRTETYQAKGTSRASIKRLAKNGCIILLISGKCRLQPMIKLFPRDPEGQFGCHNSGLTATSESGSDQGLKNVVDLWAPLCTVYKCTSSVNI